MANGTKFGCLCVRAHPVEGIPANPVEIGHGFSVSSRGPEVESGWKEALGRFQVDEIKGGTLWVWIQRESERAEVLDQENDALKERLSCFWWGLLLHEPPRIFSAWAFTGRAEAGKHDLRSAESFTRVFNHQGDRTVLDLDRLCAAAKTADAYGKIVEGGGLKGRLHNGFAAFASGMQEKFVDAAHLLFQRALEGMFHPKDRDQFVKRGRSVFRDLRRQDGDATELLASVYDMRSGFTHCETLATIFSDMSESDAKRKGISLRDATYTLAARSYRAVFQDGDLVTRFGQEGLGEYWGKVVSGKKPAPFVVELRPEDWQPLNDEEIDEG